MGGCEGIVLVLTEACLFVSVQVLSALDILQPPQIDCFEEMYLFMTLCLCVRKHLITGHSRTPPPVVAQSALAASSSTSSHLLSQFLSRHVLLSFA